MALSISEAKVLAMVIIGVGSFLIGLFPACFTNRRGERNLLLSSLLCFGAGVLLATSLLHMLPETREALPLHAELTVCCGFLLLYMVDEIVHFIWGNALDAPPHMPSHRHDFTHSHQNSHGPVTHGYAHSHTVVEKSSERRNGHSDVQVPPPNIARRVSHGGIPEHTDFERNQKSNVNTVQNRSHSCYGSIHVVQPPALDDPTPYGEEEGTLLCHGSHAEPCANTNTGLLGLLIALTLHAILEGLAVGLEAKASKVLLLVTAVASHKLVVGFCLGIELAVAGSFLRHAIAIGLFAGGSSAGIGIGMLVTQVEDNWVTNILMPVLQGVAGGSLLYVTVSEVLPRERARWHKNTRRVAGITQFFFVTGGFFFMYVLNQYTEHSILNQAGYP